jgi:hypothetical protein
MTHESFSSSEGEHEEELLLKYEDIEQVLPELGNPQ